MVNSVMSMLSAEAGGQRYADATGDDFYSFDPDRAGDEWHGEGVNRQHDSTCMTNGCEIKTIIKTSYPSLTTLPPRRMMTNNNSSMQGGPMKPMPHPYRPIPGEGEYCQKSGHTGHYRRTAQKSGPQATMVKTYTWERTETMRSEDAKRKDHPHAETVQSRGVVMGSQWGHGAAHDAKRIMIRNTLPKQGGVMKNIPHSFVLFGIMALATIAFAYPAHAGRYDLIKGKGVEVCEAYEKNLDSFSQIPSYPMACERKIDPAMKDFKKPEWKEIDAWENRELIRKIAKFLSPSDTTIDDNNWLSDLKRGIASHHMMLSEASVDIDNDGKTDNVAKYVNGACGMARSYGTSLVVLNAQKNLIDIKKTIPLFQNVTSDREKYPAGRWRYAMYDIFLYKNEAYFDKWSNDDDMTGFLHVFVTKKNATEEICTYQYHTTN